MSNSFSGKFQFITLWIQEIPCRFEVYYLETNSLVYVHKKEYHVCFLQSSTTSIGIKVSTYPGLMVNWQDGDHHNNDGGNDVDNAILTRAEFFEFWKEACDENQQFLERS